MRREPPDSQFYAEVHDLNLEFLGLLAEARERLHGPVFGLEVAVVEQVSRLLPAQLDAMAATPCLLAGFRAGCATRTLPHIAEPAPAPDAAWLDRARLFAAGLLTYTWQMSRRDPLRAALCAGPAGGPIAARMSFRELRNRVEQAVEHIEARFGRGMRFWPDLVRAARDGHTERIELARLTAIQLVTRETVPPAIFASGGSRPAQHPTL